MTVEYVVQSCESVGSETLEELTEPDMVDIHKSTTSTVGNSEKIFLGTVKSVEELWNKVRTETNAY